ncbi:MAG: ABC transporter substrate-binding protein [Desulfovibrionales bacterium]
MKELSRVYGIGSVMFSVLASLAAIFLAANAHAGMRTPPPELKKSVVVGDRVVDIAYNLGVLPEAMSVRGGLWPMAKKIKTASEILGCPNCITQKRKNAVPDALKKRGIKKLIISTGHNPYCLYKPIKPEDVLPMVKGMDIDIEYVDFSKGLEPAIRRTAELFEVEEKADSLISGYKKDMQRARKFLPKNALGRKVVIINGIYQPSSGNSLLRIEASDGYADKFLLKPLGCENVGNVFSQGKKPSKGHYMVRKRRGELDLSPMLEANPDIIVMTGDAFAVQKALEKYVQKEPEAKNVKALKNMKVYSLPGYIDSGVIEYPSVLRKWAVALGN